MLELAERPSVASRPWFAAYDPGVPATLEYPSVGLDGLLRRAAQRYPDQPAPIFFGRETSYGALDEAADRVASGLRHLELEPGDRVALFLPNCPQLVTAFYGVWRAGCVAVPANPHATGAELSRQLADADAATRTTSRRRRSWRRRGTSSRPARPSWLHREAPPGEPGGPSQVEQLEPGSEARPQGWGRIDAPRLLAGQPTGWVLGERPEILSLRKGRYEMSRSRPLSIATGAAFAIGVMVLAACSSPQTSPSALQGAGAVKTEVRSISDFTKVEVRHGMKLELTLGTPAKVELTARENLLPICTTTVADGTLTADATRDYSSVDGITIKVTTPALSELVLVGGASGSATSVTAAALTIRTEGGAILTLSGAADSLALTAKAGGLLNLGDFTAKDATVDLAGGVKVTLGVSRSVKGSATGGVALILRGSPSSVDISTTGGAVVTQE